MSEVKTRDAVIELIEKLPPKASSEDIMKALCEYERRTKYPSRTIDDNTADEPHICEGGDFDAMLDRRRTDMLSGKSQGIPADEFFRSLRK